MPEVQNRTKMNVTSIKTHKISELDNSIFNILDKYLSNFEEGSVLAVTSKIVSICEGRVVADVSPDKKKSIVQKEAEMYIPPEENKYGVTLTIKNSLLIPTAGIDESNGNGKLILWPKDPQNSANKIREYLINRFAIKNAGVIITDSTTSPLRWGVTGIAISHSGFNALNNYIGTPDIFGKRLEITKVNVMNALAVSAVFAMGEGSEQTPLAVVSEVPSVEFQDRNPTDDEINGLKIDMSEDLYGFILEKANWKKGGGE